MTGVCIETLASGQNGATSIAVDSKNVYWTDGSDPGTVMSVPLTGGTPTTVASGQKSPWALAVNGQDVYWTNRGSQQSNYIDGAVMRTSLSGGTPSTVATGQNDPQALALDAKNVYWANTGFANATGQTIMKAGLGGSTLVTLASQQTPNGIAVDASSVYWTNGTMPSAVLSVPISGGMPTTLATEAGSASAIIVQAGTVYWLTDASGKASLSSLPVAGGTPSAVTSGFSVAFTSLTSDSSALYWTMAISGSDGNVSSVAFNDPTTVSVLAKGQTFPDSKQAIAVDSTSVYWIAGNAIHRLTPK